MTAIARPLLPLLLSALLTGCGGFSSTTPSPAQTTAEPAPAQVEAAPTPPKDDVLRVGDSLQIRVSGVPAEDQATYEVKVGDKGEISMPLLDGTFQAAGLTASQLKENLEAAYRNRRIYLTPNLTILPEIRYVNISGEIRSPSRITYTNDLTLLSLITAGGGFTDYANRHDVHLLRGGKLIHFDAAAALKDPSRDIVLQAGDQVQVLRSIF